MRVVVADAGPLHYLVLTDAIAVLPTLFQQISIPEAVNAELSHPRTPEKVRTWIMSPPSWVRVSPSPSDDQLPLLRLDDGERAAIWLARRLKADLLLMDDRAGVVTARDLGLQTTGTVGILDRAARRGLISLPVVVARLKETNFRYRPSVLDQLLADHNPTSGG